MSEAPDPLATQLAALAPHVDLDASRELFERARAGRSAPRRWLLPAAVSALLVTGLVGVWALAKDEGATVPATPVERVEPSGDEFELLAVDQTVRTAGTIQYATTAEERDSALAPLTDESIDGSIDLDADLLVVFNVPGNSCPWKLDRFSVEGTLWTPQFSEVGGDCNDVGVTWAYVVGLPRRVLGNSVSFAIPPDFGGGSTLTITFDAGPPEPDFEVLLVEETAAAVGSIDTATTTDELAAALAPITDAPIDFGVDLERMVVAVFNRFGNACPLELIGFDISGDAKDVWSPRFRASAEACNDIGMTWAYVVAFDRTVFGPSVTFVMPDDADGAGEQIDPPDEPEPGEEFEMIAVEETSLPFGTIRVAQSTDEFAAWWDQDLPAADRPDVDFSDSFVASFTLPDDACPDVLVQFVGEPTDDGAAWTPQFEPPPGGCDEPLITRTYVVRIDRPATGVRVTFRLPADDVYGYDENEVSVDLAPRTVTIVFAADEAEPAASEVVFSSLPPSGFAESVMSRFGPIWVVHHDDGSVSALPAVVRMPADEDTGVTGLGRLVAWDSGSRTFTGRWIHDEYGRAVNGPRTDDLVGFDTSVSGDNVEIFRSDRDRIPGDALDVSVELDHPLRPLDLGATELIDLDVLPTLSATGPIWRHVDASLVVEDGVGTLCQVDASLPVPELTTCDGEKFVTAVASDRPEITSWFFGPVLVEFDEFGTITTVVPLGGQAARNDGPDGVNAGPSGDGWRQLLTVSDAGDIGRMPRLAVNSSDLADLARALGLEASPDVDLDDSIVIAFTVGDTPCPRDVVDVVIDESGTINPQFEDLSDEMCEDIEINRTWLVGIDRERLPDPIRVVTPDAVGGAPFADVTFDLADGQVLEGGLAIGRPIMQCAEVGVPTLFVPIELASSRGFTLRWEIGGEKIWEGGGTSVTGPMAIAGGLELDRVVTDLGVVTVASASPPAEFGVDFRVSQLELDQVVAECG